jgi:hypothetical protein
MYILTFLQVVGEMSAKKKTVVISFNEVKILSTSKYEAGGDVFQVPTI